MEKLINKYPIRIQLGTFIIVLLFIFGFANSVNSIKANLEKEITYLNNCVDNHKEAIDILKEKQEKNYDKNIEQDLILTGMAKDIKNILIGIADIKKTLND